MLVCKTCLERELDSGGGICLECAKQGRRAPEEIAREEEKNRAAESEERRFSIPFKLEIPDLKSLSSKGRLLVFASLLILLFAVVGFYPRFKITDLRRQLSSVDTTLAANAEEELITIGGYPVYKQMIDELLNGSGKSRERALHVIGELGNREALPILRRMVDDEHEPVTLRVAAREAIIQIENY